MQRERFHDYDGQPLGEARQNRRARAEDLLADLRVAHPTRDRHAASEIQSPGEFLNLSSHRSVADEHEAEIDPVAHQLCGGLDEKLLAFLFAEATDADEGARV